MAVPQEVKSIGITCRRFLFTMEIIGLFTLMLMKNELTVLISIRLLIEVIAAGYFYINCTDSAGQPLPVQDDNELQTLSRQSIKAENEQDSQIPDRNHCQECDIIQPYRTKHCTKCQKCIPKYDHHCFWIGGCVGELNHSTFWLFLFFQCTVCFESLAQFNRQLSIYSINDEEHGQDQYQYQYFFILVMAAIAFGFGIFTGALMLYHSMLIMTGKTTWEHTKRDKISYLNYYPKFYHPYDFGILKNIQTTFFHNQQHWIPPNKENIVEKFNCFDNKYYSCC